MDAIFAIILFILGIACDRIDLLVIALGFSFVATVDLGRFKIHIIYETRGKEPISKLPLEKNLDPGNK